MTAINHVLADWKTGLERQLERLLEQKWFNVGLQTKMSIIVTVGLAGLLGILAFIGVSTSRQASLRVMNERMTLARTSASNLDATLRYIQSMLMAAANQPDFQDALTSPASHREALESAFQHVSIFSQGVLLFDLDGTPVISAINHQDQGSLDTLVQTTDWSGVPALQAAIRGEPVNISVLANQQVWAVMALPIQQPDHSPYSVLAALVNLSNTEIFPVEGSFDLGKTGNLEVVDASGQVLISAHPERAIKGEYQNEIVGKFFVADKPGVETCIGCYKGSSSELEDEVIAFAPLSLAPWGVLIRQAANEVFAPVRQLMVQVLVIGLLAISGALLLVRITTNSVIEPVQMLTRATGQIATGDLNTPIECNFSRLRGRDEISVLAQSFEIMCSRLKESMDEIQTLNRELDQRVRERTQAARAAQIEAQMTRDDLKAMIDALSDDLVVVDLENYCIQQVNKTAQDKFPVGAKIVGQPCYQVFHNGSVCQTPSCACPIPGVLESGQSVKVTHVHSTLEGSEDCYLDIVASPMRDREGKITRIVELSRDVTQEKRIEESLIKRNQQLSILNAIANTVNQSLNLEDILERALDELLRLTEIDVGAVFLQKDALGGLNLVAYRGLSKRAAKLAAQFGLMDGSCGGIIEKGQIVIVPDVASYRGRRARSLERENLKTIIHVPLMAKGCALGSICVGLRKKREFSSEEQDLLGAIGNQIAVAIENARLYDEVQQKEQKRGVLLNKAITAQEEERKRIARELHDETSQSLTALLYAAEESLEMDSVPAIKKRLGGMHALTKHTLDGVHKIIFDLRPSMLDHLGLVPALRWFADSRLEPKGVRVTIEETSPARRFPAEVETALFRVVQEAITNIARHAAARNVHLGFQFEEDSAKMTIQDDGVGFDLSTLEQIPDNGRGLGIMGMQERVELIGGDLEIDSFPGQGTDIRIRIPLQERSLSHG